MQTNIRQRLSELPARPKCTIYRVYGHLRNINDKAYEPQVIAIGPYHRGKDSLEMMEDHKLRYLKSLTQGKEENVQKYISAIEPLEEKARECYANPFKLDARKFVEMLMLDGCFIIELVRKWNSAYLREENDPIFRTDWLFNSLQRDLLLFENQIPFFVLCKLFDLIIEVPDQRSWFMDLLSDFFRTIYPGKVCIESSKRSSREIKHLLDLIHINLVSSLDLSALGGGEKERKPFRFIDTATLLAEANIEFKRNDKVSVFNIRFENGTLFLPPLTIVDRTESFLRNLIAYEQYLRDSREDSLIKDYVTFFDRLINSPKDVEILSGIWIINNWLGDEEVVAKMFNKLTDSINVSSKYFIYGKIFDEMHEHCEKRRNRWMAKFRRSYLHSPWALASLLAAIALMLLTIAQTVFSAMQV